MKEMILDIKPDGTMILTVNGVSGPACKEFTKPIEDALGVVTDSQPTAEYFETETLSVKQEG